MPARITMLNPAAEGILGRSANEYGQVAARSDDMPELVTLVSDVLSGARARSCCGKTPIAGAGYLRGAPCRAPRLAGGRPLVLHDWTEVWRIERMRVEFIANASHERMPPSPR